jgi:predicted RNase H-like HicB family nuclease
MWDILLQKKKNLFDLKKLDKGLFDIFSELQLMANRKQEIDEMHVDPEMKQRLYAQVKSSVSFTSFFTIIQKGAKIEDYDLYFYDPADEEVELVKDGKTTQVTLHNLQEYIDLVLDSTFNESVRL